MSTYESKKDKLLQQYEVLRGECVRLNNLNYPTKAQDPTGLITRDLRQSSTLLKDGYMQMMRGLENAIALGTNPETAQKEFPEKDLPNTFRYKLVEKTVNDIKTKAADRLIETQHTFKSAVQSGQAVKPVAEPTRENGPKPT